MTAFADALDLRTAVIEAVGDETIADVWPRLVAMAEAKLNRVLRTRYQIAQAIVPVSTTAPLPADYLEMAALFQGNRRLAWNPSYSLTPGPYLIEYYAKVPTIAEALTATNWLLMHYPDVYLYAVAEEAARHKRDPEMAAMMKAAKDEALASLHGDDERARFGQSVVRVSGATP